MYNFPVSFLDLSFDPRKQEPVSLQSMTLGQLLLTQVKLSFQIANDYLCADMLEEITRSIKGVSVVPQLLC